MKTLLKITAAAFALSMVGCHLDKSQPNVELIQDMMESPAIKAQEYDESSPQQRGMRVPPENTIPNDFTPYKYANDFDGALQNKNPLAGEMTPEVLLVGQKYFETNCMVCHGQSGKSDTPVAEKMPNKPPMLNTDRVKGMPDGHIYHIITMGQGTMGAYASHIPQKYRWQVVNYIRHIQKQGQE